MLLLFCLLIGYGVIRLWEDTTARWRNQTPPRHEKRMERMRQRAAAGGKPPSSAFGRYAAGLADDVWTSAHEKRNLMADARRVKRQEKAKRKSAKMIARQRAKTQDAIGFSATVPGHDGAGENTALSGATPAIPASAPAAAPAPAPTGATVPSAAGSATPTAAPGAADAQQPEPVGFFAEIPQTGSGTPLPRRTPHTTTTDTWTRPVLPGEATRARARELTPQVAMLATDPDVTAAGEGGPYPMTPEQREIYDRASAALTGSGIHRFSEQEYFSLPVEARAELLDAARRIPGQGLSVAPGHEDLAALAVLAQRHGDEFDIADIYRHHTEASPEIRTAIEQEIRDNAARDTANPTPAPTGPGPMPGTAPEPQLQEEDRDRPTDTRAQPGNVIPFPTVNPDAAHHAAGKEYPTVNGEISGLDQAIQYAGGLVEYCTRAQDGIVAAAPDPDALAQSCEQATADLTRGGVRGETLTAVAEVQESVVGAAQAVKDALVQWEAAQASAQKLHTGLSEQTTVQEAYAATPDAGSREFVTNGV